MQIRKSLIPLTAAFASVLLLSACSPATGNANGAGAECTPAHEFSTLKNGSLTVAVVPVPQLIDIENGTLTGVEGDIIEGFAKAECLSITAQETGGAGIIPAVQSDRVDIATGGWAPTAEREKVIGFSDTTFRDEVVVLSTQGYGSFEELIAAGATVGSPQGNRWVEDVASLLGSKHKIYQSFDETYNDLLAGRIDATLSTMSSSISFLASEAASDIKRVVMAPDSRVEASNDAMDISLPIRKGNTEFKTALNDHIAKIRADGTLEKILISHGMPAESAPVPETSVQN